ncbi:MAG: flagellar assembly protein FliH, partial [Lysobacter sp.]
QRGHGEGLATGASEVRRMVAQMEGILDSFTRPLARLDGEVADALADLASRIAGTLVGRAYAQDPTLLADLVRDALDAVGSNSRDVELRLHPDDLGVLMPHLMTLDGVRLTGDTTLARGELRLHSESVRIDGTLDARLRACLHTILDARSTGPNA